jgi:hypothetical protein
MPRGPLILRSVPKLPVSETEKGNAGRKVTKPLQDSGLRALALNLLRASKPVNHRVAGIHVLEVWLPSLDTFRTFAGQMSL